jgi:hypothetical protein
MSDAPEKIWATRGDAGTGCWNAERSRMLIHMPDGWETEYTRTDAANARIAELEVALSKARDDALHEAANIANGYGSCACDPDMHAAILRLIEQPAR